MQERGQGHRKSVKQHLSWLYQGLALVISPSTPPGGQTAGFAELLPVPLVTCPMLGAWVAGAQQSASVSSRSLHPALFSSHILHEARQHCSCRATGPCSSSLVFQDSSFYPGPRTVSENKTLSSQIQQGQPIPLIL